MVFDIGLLRVELEGHFNLIAFKVSYLHSRYSFRFPLLDGLLAYYVDIRRILKPKNYKIGPDCHIQERRLVRVAI